MHENNIILTIDSSVKSMNFSSNIPKKYIKSFNPRVDYSKVDYFKLPHHKTNEDLYYADEYSKCIGSYFTSDILE